MGDRIVVMKDGVIQQVGTPTEIYSHPNNMFVASFIGSPAMNFLRGTLVEEGGEVTFRAEGVSVKLPGGRIAALREAGAIGKTVVLGIRPENIHDEQVYLETYPDSVVRAEVEVVENLGAESYVYLNLSGQTIVARVAARSDIKPRTNVSMGLDINKIHVFDAETEKTIF
jgi:multiple sugar transport system ATP-binding protein